MLVSNIRIFFKFQLFRSLLSIVLWHEEITFVKHKRVWNQKAVEDKQWIQRTSANTDPQALWPLYKFSFRFKIKPARLAFHFPCCAFLVQYDPMWRTAFLRCREMEPICKYLKQHCIAHITIKIESLLRNKVSVNKRNVYIILQKTRGKDLLHHAFTDEDNVMLKCPPSSPDLTPCNFLFVVMWKDRAMPLLFLKA